MNNVRYSKGDFFHDGNYIFINCVTEMCEPHKHAHEFIEISYVASGTGIHILGDKEYEVSKGDLFLINYDIPHEFRSLKDPSAMPLKVYNCLFVPEFIDTNLNKYQDFSEAINYLAFRSILPWDFENTEDIKLLGIENTNIEIIYEKMLTEFTEKKDGFIEMLRVYLTELLITIFRSLKNADAAKQCIISSHAQLIEKSVHYLKENYNVNIKLADIASKSFLSPTYFCKLFKDHTGITISEYIQKLRIEEACNLLKYTDKKVILIAQEVGYLDIKRFNEVFKKITGITPSNYRKKFV